MWRTQVFYSVADPRVRENNIIHCVADAQVMEMKATNDPVSCDCLTVDRE